MVGDYYRFNTGNSAYDEPNKMGTSRHWAKDSCGRSRPGADFLVFGAITEA